MPNPIRLNHIPSWRSDTETFSLHSETPQRTDINRCHILRVTVANPERYTFSRYDVAWSLMEQARRFRDVARADENWELLNSPAFRQLQEIRVSLPNYRIRVQFQEPKPQPSYPTAAVRLMQTLQHLNSHCQAMQRDIAEIGELDGMIQCLDMLEMRANRIEAMRAAQAAEPEPIDPEYV